MLGFLQKRGQLRWKMFPEDMRESSLNSLTYFENVLFEQFTANPSEEPPAISGLFGSHFFLLIAFSGGLKALKFLNEL